MQGFFNKCVEKYKMTIGKNKAIIIFFDAKNVTKNKAIDLYNLDEGSFSDSLIKCAKYFNIKFNSEVIVGIDEIKIIIKQPEKIIDKYGVKATDIVALLSQELFLKFNTSYNKESYNSNGGKPTGLPVG